MNRIRSTAPLRWRRVLCDRDIYVTEVFGPPVPCSGRRRCRLAQRLLQFCEGHLWIPMPKDRTRPATQWLAEAIARPLIVLPERDGKRRLSASGIRYRALFFNTPKFHSYSFVAAGFISRASASPAVELQTAGTFRAGSSSIRGAEGSKSACHFPRRARK